MTAWGHAWLGWVVLVALHVAPVESLRGIHGHCLRLGHVARAHVWVGRHAGAASLGREGLVCGLFR